MAEQPAEQRPVMRHLISLKLMTLHLEAQLAALDIPYTFVSCFTECPSMVLHVTVIISQETHHFTAKAFISMESYESQLLQDLYEKRLL